MTQVNAPDTAAPDTAADVDEALRQTRKRETANRTGLLVPALLTIMAISILPLAITVVYSFLKPGTYGGVVWEFSPNAYVQFLFERDIFDDTLSFNPAYLSIYMRSIGLALGATIGALILGFPTAYFIATKPRENRNFWLFLVTLPFWTNLLIRTFAMLLIIRDDGIINLALMKLGLTDSPLQILYTDTAVLIGLIYSFLPFMVLPLYASLEKLDFRLIEAAYDLYATRVQVLREVILPLAKPGIIAGSILVFIPCLGSYITPELLGGGKKLMIGNMIALQFGGSRNWPFGSAAALILMALVILALWINIRLSGDEEKTNG